MSVFRYPKTKFVDENTVSLQFKHVRSETDEVWQELEPGYPNRFDAKRVAEELLDVIHSSETALRILSEKHGVDIEALALSVEHKNRVRGYYAD